MKSSPIALLAGLALLPATGSAQTTTFHACYVPKSGTVYRIKASSAPSACFKEHIEFSWETHAAGLMGYAVRTGAPVQLAVGAATAVRASCAAGEVAVGGGYLLEPPDPDLEPPDPDLEPPDPDLEPPDPDRPVQVTVPWNVPTRNPAGWMVVVGNLHSEPLAARAYAVCVLAAIR